MGKPKGTKAPPKVLINSVIVDMDFEFPIWCITTASAAITAGFLHAVVSKAREHTVLGYAPCPFALPIQP
jgi:hypothetical protein